jgi:NADH-quinone oxidoreductase subunit L
MAEMIWLVLLLPFAGFVVNGLGRNVISEKVSGIIGSGAVLVPFLIAVGMLFELLGGATPTHVSYFDWIAVGDFSVSASFLVDELSVLMMLIITGVGFLIHVYSIGYMHGDGGFQRFFSFLNLFVFFMLMLVTGANYLVAFVGWEGVGLCSYFLIGFWFRNVNYSNAARKAFIMNRIGDLGFILGLFLIFTTFGTLDYAGVFSQAAGFVSGDAVIVAITLLLFVGAVGKSAQIPLFTWLPDAMAGPTPVSALIHAATMVTAGVYLCVRSNILFTLAPLTSEIVAVVGLSTALFAATIAIYQNDIKKVLAYSTVSQLGYMFLGVGVGAYTSGMFHLTTHAFFKALLFLGAGSVIHAMHHEQDIRKMGGLRKLIPVTFVTFLIGTVAIAGIPPLSGFFSKDEILAHVYQHSPVMWALAVAGSLMTAFYMFRLLYLTFFGTFRGTEEQKHHIHESPKVMTVPLIVLAALSIIGGFIGLPELIGAPHALNDFLASIYPNLGHEAHHLDHSTEWMLIGITIVLLLVAIGTARYFYVTRSVVPEPEEAKLPLLKRILYRKWYVDEIYDALIVRPVTALCNFFFGILESKYVDGLSVWLGNSAIKLGRVVRQPQTGSISFYIVLMVVGVALIFLIQLAR